MFNLMAIRTSLVSLGKRAASAVGASRAVKAAILHDVCAGIATLFVNNDGDALRFERSYKMFRADVKGDSDEESFKPLSSPLSNVFRIIVEHNDGAAAATAWSNDDFTSYIPSAMLAELRPVKSAEDAVTAAYDKLCGKFGDETVNDILARLTKSASIYADASEI